MIKETSIQDVKILLDKILKTFSFEEIAVSIGKSSNTIRRWANGTSSPCKSDLEVLKKLSAKS